MAPRPIGTTSRAIAERLRRSDIPHRSEPTAPGTSDYLDFSDREVLVVGGSSGIDDATAQLFRKCGERVHVTGTPASPDDYSAGDICNMEGLDYSRLDLLDRTALNRRTPDFKRLNRLVPCHAHTRWNGAQFDAQAFHDLVEVNPARPSTAPNASDRCSPKA